MASSQVPGLCETHMGAHMSDESHIIRSEEDLRAIIGEPTSLAVIKSADRITPPMRRFIELSPFCCIASRNGAGEPDISPRGDPAGFVHIADERTLLIPDRPGNKRGDTLSNILQDPIVALIFLIPGVRDMLRVTGRAEITTDPALLALFPVGGKLPKLVIRVHVEDALGHCSKAVRRSELWEDTWHPAKGAVPTLAELCTDHLGMPDEKVQEVHEGIESRATTTLY